MLKTFQVPNGKENVASNGHSNGDGGSNGDATLGSQEVRIETELSKAKVYVFLRLLRFVYYPMHFRLARLAPLSVAR